jgi:hypothetical protein
MLAVFPGEDRLQPPAHEGPPGCVVLYGEVRILLLVKFRACPGTLGPFFGEGVEATHGLADRITKTILFIRGEKVLLDEDLAVLYGVETKALVQAVKRNEERFPADFMFQLTQEEWDNLRSQIVTSNREGWGGRRYAPYAFTQEGVAMLSSVLRSARAVPLNLGN